MLSPNIQKARPDALAVGDFNARLEPPIDLTELIPGKQSGRGVVARYFVRPGEGLTEGLDYQRGRLQDAALDRCGWCRSGVRCYTQPFPPISKDHLRHQPLSRWGHRTRPATPVSTLNDCRRTLFGSQERNRPGNGRK